MLAGALLGLTFPCVASASSAPRPSPAAQAAAGVLTLYSEPGLRGRHATYKTAQLDVERQGFMARSAASTGMWTLCEGAEVASRCQTVDGQAAELKFAPQLVRPGLNAIALYDQPGLKGRRVIYSFPADRPAPFHARSARTWGGAWSLCQRGFKHCQALDGRMANLDLVVEAVRPETGDAETHAAAAPPPAAIPVSTRPAAKSRRIAPQPTQDRPSERAPRPPRLVHADDPAPKTRRPEAIHALRVVHASAPRLQARKPSPVKVRILQAKPTRPPHRGIMIEFVESPRARHADVDHRWRPARPVQAKLVSRHPPRPRLVRHVTERHRKPAHNFRPPDYRRVRMTWGGNDPYLYDVEPREPPPWW